MERLLVMSVSGFFRSRSVYAPGMCRPIIDVGWADNRYRWIINDLIMLLTNYLYAPLLWCFLHFLASNLFFCVVEVVVTYVCYSTQVPKQ